MLHVDKMDMRYNLNYYHWMYLTLKTGRTGTFLTGQVEHLNHSDCTEVLSLWTGRTHCRCLVSVSPPRDATVLISSPGPSFVTCAAVLIAGQGSAVVAGVN